jgi:hypothetical protein|nr:MAG TPA: Sf6 terminase small subunit gp1, octamer, DNA-binding, CAPS buffer.65A [Caudoviricetes sp.]
MPRKKIEIDLKKVEEYAQICDNEEEIALALGIGYATLKRRKKDNELFELAIKTGRAKANAFVGGKLMQLVREGNPAATIFYMKSRCGWRETVRQEITGAEGGSIKIDNNPDLDDVSLDDLKKARALLYEKKSTPSDTD